ncbi:hypothetical protein [Paeniglutamicibacter terrestris]|uniref:CARDB domain-containing protein n=1 Tax=Paeniglutamicibacter terrestris TaxID=2723403 RepID=A0ABX1FZZ0_9MICC|nr:hypothetical protein [Paeniglutamicibacter terrestris]NKG19527.1 hypothetical protein [Paeniglutamicibacter terrestris]
MPPPYKLSSQSVRAGSSVSISAPDATCNPRYGTNAQVHIELLDSNSQILSTALSPMSDAGAFSYSLVVPTASKTGHYWVSATPFVPDWCDDTGKNNRVESAGQRAPLLDLDRVSCALPLLELVVTS